MISQIFVEDHDLIENWSPIQFSVEDTQMENLFLNPDPERYVDLNQFFCHTIVQYMDEKEWWIGGENRHVLVNNLGMTSQQRNIFPKSPQKWQ